MVGAEGAAPAGGASRGKGFAGDADEGCPSGRRLRLEGEAVPRIAEGGGSAAAATGPFAGAEQTKGPEVVDAGWWAARLRRWGSCG